ncbi:MAG: hypothetical protein ACKO2P_17020 [Planctomycetota bacterium]
MSVRSLSQPCSLAGTPSTQVDRVDTRIFKLTYYRHCMDCSFCGDRCCQYGVDVDLENVARLQAAPEELEQFIGYPRSRWFQDEVTCDAEYPGGGSRKTQVIDGRCVFLNRKGRGCLLHSWCFEQGIPYQQLKPMISSLFPVTFDQGLLLPSAETLEGSLVCVGAGDTLYRGAREDLRWYFGEALVRQLDAIEQEQQQRPLPTKQLDATLAGGIERSMSDQRTGE